MADTFGMTTTPAFSRVSANALADVAPLASVASMSLATTCPAGSTPRSASPICAMVSAFRWVAALAGSRRWEASTWCRPWVISICRIRASDRAQSWLSETTPPSRRTRLAAMWMWSPWLTTAYPSKPIPVAHSRPMAAHSASSRVRSSAGTRMLMCATWTPRRGRRS